MAVMTRNPVLLTVTITVCYFIPSTHLQMMYVDVEILQSIDNKRTHTASAG